MSRARSRQAANDDGLADLDVVDLGVTPQQVFPARALAPRFASNTLFIHPEGIAGTVYTRYQSGNAPAAAYERHDLRAAAEIAVDRVRRAS